MRSSVPVRRATAGWSDEKRNGRTATGSPTAAVDLLPVTIQQAQTLSSRNRRKPGWLVRFFRALPSASSDTDRFSITGKRMRQRGNASRFLASVANGGMLWVMLGIGGVITIYLILSGRFLQAQSAAGVFYWQLSKPHTVTFLAHRQRQRKEMYLPPPMGYDLQDQGKNIPDLGGLLLFVFEEEGQTRQIYHDFSQDEGQVYEIPSEGADDLHDYYYAFDDDALRNPLIAYDDENIQDEKQCRRVSWHRDTLLNCNSFHELGLAYNNLDSLEMKGAGTYRQVFATEQPVLDKPETVIFKEYIYTADYIYSDFEFMRMDAVVSEIFTSSPLFVDIYGYCGLSMLSEYLELGDLEAHATPDGPRDEEVVLHDEEDLDPQNSFNARDKLFISLEMAEALALLHSYPGGVIVHDDVQLAQFLPTKEGHLKMNDFNRAEIMLFNEEDQEYCRYKNNPGNGDWRAPEEYVDAPLNEKIDVWSLGNNMYAVLTGLNPYYKELHQSEVKRLVRHGEKPFVDPRWRTRSHAERALVETMELCWEFNADDRIDVFEVVKRLQHALEVEYQQDAKNGVESPAATVEYR